MFLFHKLLIGKNINLNSERERERERERGLQVSSSSRLLIFREFLEISSVLF